MAKRNGSSASASRTPRRAVHTELATPKPTPAKGQKKRPSSIVSPQSRARSKGTTDAVITAPESKERAKRQSKQAGSSRSAERSLLGSPRAGAARPKRIAPRRAGRIGPPFPSSVPPPAHASARVPPRIPTPPLVVAPRSMELEWSREPSSVPPEEAALDRWVRRGDELLRKLAEHGAANHEYRASFPEGRFFWVDPNGRVSAEASMQLLCTYVPQTQSVTMGWADPRTASVAPPRVPGIPSEVDDIDEEGAWRLAMAIAEHTSAHYLYRVRLPVQSMFLALTGLTFSPTRADVEQATPVAFVLGLLRDVRSATELGAEPLDTLRSRIFAAGATLVDQAEYSYRNTDWVARLLRTGKRLTQLAERLPRPTFQSVAEGASTVWLERRLASDLVESIVLLEEEWEQFA